MNKASGPIKRDQDRPNDRVLTASKLFAESAAGIAFSLPRLKYPKFKKMSKRRTLFVAQKLSICSGVRADTEPMSDNKTLKTTACGWSRPHCLVCIRHPSMLIGFAIFVLFRGRNDIPRYTGLSLV